MPIIKSLSEASGSYASEWCEWVWGGRWWCGQGRHRAGGIFMPIIKSLSEASGSYASEWCEWVWGGGCWCGQGRHRAGGIFMPIIKSLSEASGSYASEYYSLLSTHYPLQVSGVNGCGVLGGGVDKEGTGQVPSSRLLSRACRAAMRVSGVDGCGGWCQGCASLQQLALRARRRVPHYLLLTCPSCRPSCPPADDSQEDGRIILCHPPAGCAAPPAAPPALTAQSSRRFAQEDGRIILCHRPASLLTALTDCPACPPSFPSSLLPGPRLAPLQMI